MTKKTIRCSKCERAYIVLGCGFTSIEELHCSRDNLKVTKGDGCTMGRPGCPMIGVNHSKIVILDKKRSFV